MEMIIGDRPRFKYKGWFAQTYYIKNDGGDDSNPNYLNRTGLIVPLERSHYEAQIQYNFNDQPYRIQNGP